MCWEIKWNHQLGKLKKKSLKTEDYWICSQANIYSVYFVYLLLFLLLGRLQEGGLKRSYRWLVSVAFLKCVPHEDTTFAKALRYLTYKMEYFHWNIAFLLHLILLFYGLHLFIFFCFVSKLQFRKSYCFVSWDLSFLSTVFVFWVFFFLFRSFFVVLLFRYQ